jgi:hypothetical protein
VNINNIKMQQQKVCFVLIKFFAELYVCFTFAEEGEGGEGEEEEHA